MAATFCTTCGKALDPDDQFCAACGAAVTKTDDDVPAPEPVTTPAPERDVAATVKPRWRKKRYWIPAVIVLVAVISVATSGNKSNNNSPSSAGNGSAAASAPAPAPVPATPSVPKSVSAARSYISNHGHDINTVHVMVQSVQAGVVIAQKSPTQEVINQLALLAQQAHDNIDQVRQNFALNASDSGSLGDAELEVFGAANDLKNSMGALVAYTGDPNAATLAHFASQYQRAVAEWDDGIKTIWKAAHRKKPPTL